MRLSERAKEVSTRDVLDRNRNRRGGSIGHDGLDILRAKSTEPGEKRAKGCGWGCRCFNINRPIHSSKLFLQRIGHLIPEEGGDQKQWGGFDQSLSSVRHRSSPHFAQPIQSLPKGPPLSHNSAAEVLTKKDPSRSAERQTSLIEPMSKRGYQVGRTRATTTMTRGGM